jgi:hypothetical protein
MTTPVPTSPDCATPQSCCGMRQSGRAVINDIIHRLRRRADHLETLSKMLPAEPTHEQDEALWQVAVTMERV